MSVKKEKGTIIQISFRKCRLCPYRTKSSFHYFNHVLLHNFKTKTNIFECHVTPLKNHKCEKCTFETDLKVDLQNHVDSVHKMSKFKDTSHRNPQNYKCKGCDFDTSSSLILLRHLTSSEDTTKCGLFKCQKCRYVTTNQAYFKAHRVIKHYDNFTAELYECEQCPSYATVRKSNLVRHTITKHGDPDDAIWYECDQCTFKTATKSSLKEHAFFRHTRDYKWLECEQCKFKTKTPKLLQKHVVGCHGDKTIECEKCTYKCSTEESLKRHIKNMHDENREWFKCDQCMYKAKKKFDLQRHVKSKHGNDELVCKYCDYRTDNEWCLKTHMDGFHGDEETMT